MGNTGNGSGIERNVRDCEDGARNVMDDTKSERNEQDSSRNERDDAGGHGTKGATLLLSPLSPKSHF